MPIFCQLNLEFGKRYKNDVRVIFDQWPKQNIGFDVEPEIQTLKVIYSKENGHLIITYMVTMSI